MENIENAIEKAKRIKIDKSKGSLFNSWRARIYTKKGRLAGFPEEWKTFQGFLENIPDGWEHGKILVRYDPTLPFSRENCRWTDPKYAETCKLIKLEYNGEIKTVAEWCVQYNLNYNGVRQRYFKGKNYTAEQILFGKRIINNKTITSFYDTDDEQAMRTKASKMVSSYRCKDKKRGFECNITTDILLDMVKDGRCVYCGDVHKLGLDRIDNSKGHTLDNVVLCCYDCNTARNNNFSHEEMLELGKTIAAIKRKRNGTNAEENCKTS